MIRRNPDFAKLRRIYSNKVETDVSKNKHFLLMKTVARGVLGTEGGWAWVERGLGWARAPMRACSRGEQNFWKRLLFFDEIGVDLQQNIPKNYGELLLDEHKQQFFEYQNQLNRIGSRIMRYSKHGYHYTTCCWSNDDAVEGPDTCECFYTQMAETRINKLVFKRMSDNNQTPTTSKQKKLKLSTPERHTEGILQLPPSSSTSNSSDLGPPTLLPLNTPADSKFCKGCKKYFCFCEKSIEYHRAHRNDEEKNKNIQAFSLRSKSLVVKSSFKERIETLIFENEDLSNLDCKKFLTLVEEIALVELNEQFQKHSSF
ncbi:hypothetical protein NQ317_001534 [Molorchus minor]|uniref:Uncharacterized protein n=1 Tax=Molorchus minor TaxID=1323400 RepID=A0ABQ9JPU0_9CUCU|nr:hypothetical protein NQ317_001534 [Molorchus minor]